MGLGTYENRTCCYTQREPHKTAEGGRGLWLLTSDYDPKQTGNALSFLPSPFSQIIKTLESKISLYYSGFSHQPFETYLSHEETEA